MGITIILISHSMDDLAEHVERMLVMNDGKLAMDDSSREVFKRREELESMGLTVPQVSAILSDLARMGLDVDTGLITVEEAKQEILRALSR